MFTGFHDQGGGFTIGLSGDVGEFVCGQIGQIVASMNTRFNQLGNQI